MSSGGTIDLVSFNQGWCWISWRKSEWSASRWLLSAIWRTVSCPNPQSRYPPFPNKPKKVLGHHLFGHIKMKPVQLCFRIIWNLLISPPPARQKNLSVPHFWWTVHGKNAQVTKQKLRDNHQQQGPIVPQSYTKCVYFNIDTQSGAP